VFAIARIGVLKIMLDGEQHNARAAVGGTERVRHRRLKNPSKLHNVVGERQLVVAL